MKKLFKLFKYIDFAGALATLAWAIHKQSWALLALSLVAFFLAWYSPGERLSRYLQKTLIGKIKRNKPLESFTEVPESILPVPPVSTVTPPRHTYRTGWVGLWRVPPAQGVHDFLPQQGLSLPPGERGE